MSVGVKPDMPVVPFDNPVNDVVRVIKSSVSCESI